MGVYFNCCCLAGGIYVDCCCLAAVSGNYHRLNAMTTTDRYHVGNIQDLIIDRYSKGNIRYPFFKEKIKKTAVITPFDLYIFSCSPFTLKKKCRLRFSAPNGQNSRRYPSYLFAFRRYSHFLERRTYG